MKKSDRLKKEAEKTMEKIESISRHIKNVENNCLLLGKNLIERGEIELGHKLIANGFAHDISKFSGIEFEFMTPEKPLNEENAKLKLKLAIRHHNLTNLHHPEAWPHGIKEMSKVALAEFTCDIKSRSEEFGTDLRQWIDETATKKYEFTKDDAVYKEIMEFVDILCPKPFENIT